MVLVAAIASGSCQRRTIFHALARSMRRGVVTLLLGAPALLHLAGSPAARAEGDFDADLKSVRDSWAIANYKTPKEQQPAAFEALMVQSAALVKKYPGRPEALIWDGIVLSTYAGVKGGLGALAPARQSRAQFEAALEIDDKAMGGLAYTSLGALYHRLPGFPIAFGSDEKARIYLEKALQISPDAIDPNYFYGEFLYDDGKYAQALTHLERALKAPPRPGREVADEGRRQQIRALIAKAKEETGG